MEGVTQTPNVVTAHRLSTIEGRDSDLEKTQPGKIMVMGILSFVEVMATVVYNGKKWEKNKMRQELVGAIKTIIEKYIIVYTYLHLCEQVLIE